MSTRPYRTTVGTVMLQVAALALVTSFGAASRAWAQNYSVDSAASQALTASLRHQRLPLVGAQLLKSSTGMQRIVLYGFVATDFGKRDAERKALAYVGSKEVPIENRIVVRPEISKLRSHPATSHTAPAASSRLTFDQIISDIDRYGIKSPPDESPTR